MAFKKPIIHLEFEQLRGYDVIVSYQWDCTLSLIKKYIIALQH